MQAGDALNFDASRQQRDFRIDCTECDNFSGSVWCLVREMDWDVLRAHKKIRVYRPGEYLFHENDPCDALYCVKDGIVALRKFDGRGHALIVKLAFASEPLGYRALFAGTGYAASAQSLCFSHVCIFDRASVSRMLQGNETLMLEFLRRMAVEVRQCHEDAVARSFVPVRARVARLLVTLIEAGGGDLQPDEVEWRLPVSKHELAALLAIRPETLARSLRALADDGLLELKNRSIRIPSVTRLGREYCLLPG